VHFVRRYTNIIMDDHARALPLGYNDRVKIISSHRLIAVLMISHNIELETQRDILRNVKLYIHDTFCSVLVRIINP